MREARKTPHPLRPGKRKARVAARQSRPIDAIRFGKRTPTAANGGGLSDAFRFPSCAIGTSSFHYG